MDFEDNNSKERILKLVKKFESNLNRLGSIYFSSDEIESIIQYYKEDFFNDNMPKALDYAIRNFPRNPTFMVHNAEYFLFSKSEKAKDYIEEALEIEPSNPDLILMYARFYIEQNNLEKGLMYLTKAYKLADDELQIDVLYTQLEAYLSIKNLIKAKHSFYKIVTKALKLGLNSKNLDDYHINASVFMFNITGHTQSLLEAIDAIIDMRPYEDIFWYIKGLVHEDLEEQKESCNAFEYAHLIKEDNKDYQYNFALALIEINELKKAEALLLALLEEKQFQDVIHMDLAELYEMQNLYSEAEQMLHLSLKINNKDSEVWLKLGNIAKDTDRNDEALICYQNACKYGNNDFDFVKVLADFYVLIGEETKAIDILESVEEDYVQAALKISEILASEDEYLKAIEYLKVAMAKDPDNSEVLYRIASYYFKYKIQSEGIKYLIEALDLDFDGHKEMLANEPGLMDYPEIIKIIEFYRNNEEDDEFRDI